MSVVSVRLTEEEKAFLGRLVKEGKYQSISDALIAGIHEIMQEEQLKSIPWESCEGVRRYFAKKKRKLKGLEEMHDD